MENLRNFTRRNRACWDYFAVYGRTEAYIESNYRRWGAASPDVLGDESGNVARKDRSRGRRPRTSRRQRVLGYSCGLLMSFPEDSHRRGGESPSSSSCASTELCPPSYDNDRQCHREPLVSGVLAIADVEFWIARRRGRP